MGVVTLKSEVGGLNHMVNPSTYRYIGVLQLEHLQSREKLHASAMTHVLVEVTII